MLPSPDPRIHCLLQAADAHPTLAAGIPPDGLLSPAEIVRCAGFTVPKRRRDWLLGRWTAKHLIQSHLGATQETVPPLDRIEILADGDGAPYARAGERLPLSLSISHSGFESFCAVCASHIGQVGADVEQVEPRELAFVRTFFTPAENAAVAAAAPGERDALLTALWSTKEAVLKTLRLGLHADTRQVEIMLAGRAAEWRAVTTTVDPQLLPSPSARVGAWCLVQSTHVLSLALLSTSQAVD